MRAEDYQLKEVSATLRDYGAFNPVNSLAEKRAAAIEWMGPKWVLHPNNRVKKLSEPLPDVFKWQPTVLKKKEKK